MKKETSWGKVAKWYDRHLDGDNTYHAQVVLPNLLRIVELKPGESLLELGCGQGYFVEKFLEISANVTGVDIGKELINIAKNKFPKAKFLVGNAEDPKILKGEQFDVVTIILAIQNMKDLSAVVKNLGRLTKENGRVVIVLNHPAFRIPQNSGWGTDADLPAQAGEKSQYRRVDAYMTELEIKIDMNPGKLEDKKITMSYHRPLQVYSKAFAKEGFAITKIEEWISHRKSEQGPHAKAEDKARKEIPLFMCLLLKKL